MADIKTMAGNLATLIAGPTGLTSFGYAPGQVVPPAVVVIPAKPAIIYGRTMNGMGPGEVDISLLAICAVSAADDESGQDALLDLISTNTSQSVLLAVQVDPTLGGTCEFAEVMQVVQYGVIDYAGQPYLGATFLVSIGAHG